MARAPVIRLPVRAAGLTAVKALPTDASDPELVRRTRAGDLRAEEALFRKHAPYITALAFKLLGDRSEAEDIVQETFLDAIRHLRALAEPLALRQWLAGIAVHKVHRRFRRRRLQSLLGLLRATDSTVLESCAHPETSPELCAELGLLDLALARLTDVDRAAWVLRYVEGYALDDVASLCECSLATVKRRIARAQVVVRAHVQLDDDGGPREVNDV
jgi:RNA polymerase sigma-70 factor (ECF subfamily)